MALKKVSDVGSGSTDTRDLGMTDSSWGDPEGLNLHVGHTTWPNRAGKSQGSGHGRLIQVADEGQEPWTVHYTLPWSEGWLG